MQTGRRHVRGNRINLPSGQFLALIAEMCYNVSLLFFLKRKGNKRKQRLKRIAGCSYYRAKELYTHPALLSLNVIGEKYQIGAFPHRCRKSKISSKRAIFRAFFRRFFKAVLRACRH